MQSILSHELSFDHSWQMQPATILLCVQYTRCKLVHQFGLLLFNHANESISGLEWRKLPSYLLLSSQAAGSSGASKSFVSRIQHSYFSHKNTILSYQSKQIGAKGVPVVFMRIFQRFDVHNFKLFVRTLCGSFMLLLCSDP